MQRLTCLLAATVLVLLLSVLVGCAPAWTQQPTPPCGPRQSILEQLQRDYAETPVSRGLASNGTVLELLTSPDGSTWTMLITLPNGTSCFGAAGEMWGPADAKPNQGRGI